MEGIQTTIIIVVYALLGISLIFIPVYKWLTFGWKLFIKGTLKKGKVALLFIKDKSNNIGFPRIVNINREEYNIGNKKYLLNENFLGEGRFFGFPYFIFTSNDSKTSAGWYFHKTDEEGIPLFKKNGEKIITPIKPSVSLPPEIFEAIVTSEHLTSKIKELFKKHQVTLYILLGIGGLLLVSVYLNYQVYSEKIPEILEVMKNNQELIKNMGGTVDNVRIPLKP